MSIRKSLPLLMLAITMLATRAYGIHCHGAKCVHCPQCQACCELEVKEDKEEKHCWNVECKDVCVPCVVFPWQKHHAAAGAHGGAHGACNCPACTCGAGGQCEGSGGNGCQKCCTAHNGARLIKVRVAVKEKYECPVCSYKWSPLKCDEPKKDEKKEDKKDAKKDDKKKSDAKAEEKKESKAASADAQPADAAAETKTDEAEEAPKVENQPMGEGESPLPAVPALEAPVDPNAARRAPATRQTPFESAGKPRLPFLQMKATGSPIGKSRGLVKTVVFDAEK